MKARAYVVLSLLLLLSIAGYAQAPPSTARAVVLFTGGWGIGAHSPVLIDGNQVATLKPGHYLNLAVASGFHTFTAQDIREGAQLTVEAGKTYYFRIRAFGETAILEPISDSAAQYDLHFLKP